MAGRGRCQLASSGWRWVFGQSSRKRKAFAQPISDMPRSDMPRSDMARSSAALCARRFEVLSAPKGVGNAGCPWHPQPPVQQESTGVEAAGPPESPGIPTRNGFNGFLRALLGDHAWLPPSSADRSAHLTPASERQDHTTSPSASAPFVRVPDDRSQAEARPAISLHARRRRVHRIPSRVRDDREPPLDGTRQRQDKSDLGQSRNDLFLRGGLDSLLRRPPVGQITFDEKQPSAQPMHHRQGLLSVALYFPALFSTDLKPTEIPRRCRVDARH